MYTYKCICTLYIRQALNTNLSVTWVLYPWSCFNFWAKVKLWTCVVIFQRRQTIWIRIRKTNILSIYLYAIRSRCLNIPLSVCMCMCNFFFNFFFCSFIYYYYDYYIFMNVNVYVCMNLRGTHSDILNVAFEQCHTILYLVCNVMCCFTFTKCSQFVFLLLLPNSRFFFLDWRQYVSFYATVHRCGNATSNNETSSLKNNIVFSTNGFGYIFVRLPYSPII